MGLISTERKSHKFYIGILIALTLLMGLPGLSKIQVIDRDEARYAQATVQMVESGDYINIKFQDRARNKKPAGIYWMQAVFVKAFTDPGERAIWTHRIVSVLGAILAVFATYWGTLTVLGRRGAFISGVVLTSTILMAAEAHIAKTDAMLCGLSAVVLACLLRLQRQNNAKTAILFWVALALAIMVKGPITIAIVLLTLIAYGVWSRDVRWMRGLINAPGILLAILIIVPWTVAITLETGGAFFTEAVGGDLAPKMAGGQESHGAPPGYYLATLPILFWPGVLLLLPGIVFVWKAAGKGSQSSDLKSSLMLLICWVLPFWIILELVPTKLPNYPLPLYPALAIFCAGGFFALSNAGALKISRRLSALLFFAVGIVLITVVFAADGYYSESPSFSVYVYPVFVAFVFAATYFMWFGEVRKSIVTALILTGLFAPLTFGHILPRLGDLQVSDRLADIIQAERPARILSPNFTEPSLVYNLGTDIYLGDKADRIIEQELKSEDLIIIDKNEALETHQRLSMARKISDKSQCIVTIGALNGTNYSKGDPVDITIYKVGACGALKPREMPDAEPNTRPVP
ncbi:MAG: glycosyltransferase family 39 protein [Hellea sp.]|nr:glycosyltransferase family 39 protein [Hellea sp.]